MNDSINKGFVLRSRSILIGVFAFMCSCGVGKKNDTNDVSVPVVLKAGVTVEAPKTVLYKNSEIRNIVSEIPLANEAMSFLSSAANGLFSAVGDGGLGVTSIFDENNKLEKYEGIPINITGVGSQGESPTVSITASGDKNCDKIFNYDPSNSKILIDYSAFNKLSICKIKAKASLTLNGEKVSDEKEFEVVLNPTLVQYSNNNDQTYKYLLKYEPSNQHVLHVAKWMIDPRKKNRLDLHYNASMKESKINIKDLDALMGAQSVTEIDLSGTDVEDLRAILYLQNLKSLNLSGCKKLNLESLSGLKDFKTLKSLNVSNLGIKDLKIITDNMKDLEELDISGNLQITDLENIHNLPNLKVLKASGIGLTSIKNISDATQITELDISNNDFSKATKSDAQTLAHLYNLTSLNVSNSHIPDEYLDEYFGKIYSRNTLKKFVDANSATKSGEYVTEEECKKNSNNFDQLKNFKHMTSLEYIDIHGNRCFLSSLPFYSGLLDTSQFLSMSKLKYLDISDNPVERLNALATLPELKTLHLSKHPYIDENNQTKIKTSTIGLPRRACEVQLEQAINPIAYECGFLEQKQIDVEFTKASTTKFEIPKNVYSISISSCSAGDGGNGGDGSPGTRSQGESCSRVPCEGRGTNCRECHPITFEPSQPLPGISGSNGEVVKISNAANANLVFVSSVESLSFYPIEKYSNCRGGLSGGSKLSGASKKLVEANLNVIPGQLLDIFVPEGGRGGAGGTGGRYYQVNDRGPGGRSGATQNGYNGADGVPGLNGGDGYLKITYFVAQD